MYCIESGADLLWKRSWRDVSIGQAERRMRLSEKVKGQPLGWYDAGTHWQEANAHCAYIEGLADVLAFRGGAMDGEDRMRLAAQIRNGCDYLAHLQDLARERGRAEGLLLHQSFKIDHLCFPVDAVKAASAWARAAEVLPDPDIARDYRRRAVLALDVFLRTPPYDGLPACDVPHLPPLPRPLPAIPATPDLARAVHAALRLGDPRVFRLARDWMDRAFAPADAVDGVYGHFRLFPGHPTPEAGWAHGFDPEGHGFHLGMTQGHHLLPFVELLRRHPGHEDAPRWRAVLENFVEGYLLPGCAANPFGIAPLAHYAGEGWIWFAGLWHGANAHFAQTAALALELAALLRRPELRATAHDNLQWIAGLNAGIAAPHLDPASHMWRAELPADRVMPVSMINGIGQNWAGSWLNIRGSICNGFACGDQFVWDVPPRQALDGPHSFTDEDWITHAGAWLSAIARLNPQPGIPA